MTIRTSHLLALLALAAMAGSASAKTQPPPRSPLVAALEACRAVADATQRLACFDRASAALIAATTKGEVTVVDRADMRKARRSLFGFSVPKLPFFGGDRSAEDDKDELETTITAVRPIGNGRFLIRVAEGNALWETLESYMSFADPRKGQKVIIKRGPLGSYFVRINNQRGVKGKRVG